MQRELTVTMKQKNESDRAKSQSTEVFDFFGDLKGEFRRISWTERHQVGQYVKVVVVSTLVAGISIYLVDVGITLCLHMLNSVLRFIGG